MFEQSILSDNDGARKSGALAASFTAQMLAAGVLLVVPLLYNEALPAIRLASPLFLPPAPVVVVAEPHAQTKSLGPAPPVRFRRPVVFDSRPSSTIPRVEVTLPDYPTGPGGDTVVGPAFAPQFGPTIVFEPPKPRDVPAQSTPPIVSPVPIHVTSDLQAAKILRKVVPPYPPFAKQVRVQGTVHLMGVIARDGTVQQLKVVSGHPALVKAAIDAVAQWLYGPTILNGHQSR